MTMTRLNFIFCGQAPWVASICAVTLLLAFTQGPQLTETTEPTDAVAAGGSSRADGTYGGLRSAGEKDAHHVIQDAAVRDLPGYSRSQAPAVQLDGPSTRVGSEHYNATQVQRERGGGTYGAERRIGYKALRKGGLTREKARAQIEKADAYFGGLGVTKDTPVRTVGNRNRK